MIAMDAKCTVCGGPTKVAFSTGRAFKYCSDVCRSKARNSSTWNGGTKLQHNTQCERCGTEFQPSRYGQKYCGPRCRYEADRDRGTERRRAVAPKVHCQHCEKRIEGGRANQRYCSSECRETYEIQRRQQGRMYECKGCGKAFKSRNPQKYCREECRASFDLSKYYTPRPPRQVACDVCGVDFEGRGNKKRCSAKCSRRAKRRREKSRVKNNIHKGRCEAYHRRYQPINPQQVFERDKWICGICFAPVDKDTVIPDPLAASLDHRIPLSKGGHHELDNVRCAHFGCNSYKSDKLDEEINWPAADPKHQRTS